MKPPAPATPLFQPPGAWRDFESQQTAVPSLDNSFDSAAEACSAYFSLQGYDKIAQVSGGCTGNQTVLSDKFCANVDADLKEKKGNSSASGLSEKLPKTVYTDCAGLLEFAGESSQKREPGQ